MRPSLGVRASIALMVSILWICTTEVVAATDTTIVITTESGPVRGAIGATTVTFLGIPYAEAPVGDLRWRPPHARARWTGVRDALQFGKHCPQPGSAPDASASEACLFLNVYVPKSPDGELVRKSVRPVMVFIHGGAHASGASESYDPVPLVDTGGVIVVTLNYRLGPLGFLAHPAFDAESHTTGNYGLMDQQLVLRWVQANAGGFGGDAQNVTVFGESAGGLDVISHIASPLSAGLMSRAIVQSGSYQLITPSLATSESQGIAFAVQVGCADQMAACLRSKTIAELMANAGNAYNQSTVDGQVLPRTQLAALLTGTFNHVPVLHGANSHEGRFFLPPTLDESGYQTVLSLIAAATGKSAAQVIAAYPLDAFPSPFEAASAAYGDAAYACTGLVANSTLSQSVPAYAYEFDDAAASPLGAMHSAELKYLFNVNFGGPQVGPSSLPGSSQVLAATIRNYWTNFARSGSPNASGLAEWAPISAQSVQQLLAPTATSESVGAYGAKHQCAFWN